MKSAIAIAVGCLLCSASLSAQSLSLDECVALALENNSRMLTAEYSLASARETSRQAFTNYFPSISLTGLAFAANHGMLRHDLDLPLSMLGLGLPDMTYSISMLKKGSVAGAMLMQPVFMGGRIVNGNRLAHVGEEVSRLQKRQSADEVRHTTEEYFWQLATLKAKHTTVDAAIAMLDTLTAQVESYVDAGITTSNDLLEVKLKRNEMLSARAELDNGISVVRMLLSQYIGKGIAGNIDIAESLSPDSIPPFPFEIFRSPEECLDATVGYGLLSQNVKAKELEQKMAVGANLPVIAAGASYNYEHLMEQGHTFGNVFVSVSVPITDWWGGSHNIKQKQLATRIAKVQLEDNAQLLMIAMTNAWNDLRTAYTQLEIAHESIAQAAENLRLNQNFYRAGTVTVTDLLNAQTLHRQAQDKYVESFGTFNLKRLTYLQSTGR